MVTQRRPQKRLWIILNTINRDSDSLAWLSRQRRSVAVAAAVSEEQPETKTVVKMSRFFLSISYKLQKEGDLSTSGVFRAQWAN